EAALILLISNSRTCRRLALWVGFVSHASQSAANDLVGAFGGQGEPQPAIAGPSECTGLKKRGLANLDRSCLLVLRARPGGWLAVIGRAASPSEKPRASTSSHGSETK